MSKKRGNRYKLVCKKLDGNEEVFYLDYEDGTRRNNFSLTELDAFTTNFEDKDQMISAISFLFPNWNGGNLWIEYKYGNKTNRLDLVFNDQINLSKISKEISGKSNLGEYDSVNKYICDFIWKMWHNQNTLDYLVENNFLSEYASKMIKLYRYGLATYKEVYNILSNYKVIRGIEIGIKNYQKKLENEKSMQRK